LAQSQRAGLTALSAVDIMQPSAGSVLQQRLGFFRQGLIEGQPVFQAGLGSGLFLPWEARLVQAAEVSGKLADSYTALARRHASRAHRGDRLRRGLALPLAVFVLAVLVAPLPALLLGNTSLDRYVLHSVGRLALFFGALYLLSWSWRRLGATGADNILFRWLLRVPWFGGLIRRQQQHDYLFSLALLLDAGVPAFDALGVAAGSVSHPGLRTQFGCAETSARNGSSVTDALDSCGILPDEAAMNLVRTAEFSGRLSGMLHHVAAQLDEYLELQRKAISDWAPKFAYLAVVVLFVLGR
jgi:type II secretory pathway component PulF